MKPYDEKRVLNFIWSVCRKITEVEIWRDLGKQNKR